MFTWEILKRGYIARGIRDWQKMLPTRKAIEEEMERMRLEAEQKKKPGPEGMAIKKLMDQGMGQEEATALLQSQVGGGNVKKLVTPAG